MSVFDVASFRGVREGNNVLPVSQTQLIAKTVRIIAAYEQNCLQASITP